MTCACPYACEFQYGTASKGSSRTPSTNVPILCDLCPLPPKYTGATLLPAVWKYNMEHHIRNAHPEHPLESLSPEFLAKFKLEPTEENDMTFGTVCQLSPKFIMFQAGSPSVTSTTGGSKRQRTESASNPDASHANSQRRKIS